MVAPLPSDFASSGLVGSALLHRLRAMSTGRGASRNGSPPRETRSSKVGDEMRCSKARDAMDNCFCRRVQVWSEFIRERVLKRVASVCRLARCEIDGGLDGSVTCLGGFLCPRVFWC